MSSTLNGIFGSYAVTRGGSYADKYFEEWPVTLDEFVTGSRYLANPPLSGIQYDAVRHAERIYYPEMYWYLAEHASHAEGAAATAELRAYWARDVRMVNFLELEWGKGCKLAGMEIYDAGTGQWVKVEDWGGGQVAAADERCRVGRHKASESWKAGRGDCYEVTFASGVKHRVYAGHRYMQRGPLQWRDVSMPRRGECACMCGQQAPQVDRGRPRRWVDASHQRAWEQHRVRYYATEWKQLRDLKPGDYVAASTFLPEPEHTVAQDPREVELVGLWLGDGCLPDPVKRKYAVGLTVGTCSLNLRSRYVALAESFGCTVSSRQANAEQLFAVGPGGKGNNPLLELAYRWNLSGQHARTKHVPAEFYSLPNDQVALLLSRMWDTDGHIYVPAKAVPEAAYTTASRQLATDVHRLLLRLGCRAQIQEKKVRYDGEQRTYWCVRMRDRTNVLRFCEQVSLLDKEPQRLAAIESCKSSGNGKTRLRHGDLAWDQIKSVEYIGEHDYYDLEVPGPQNYASEGGTLNHNSGKDHVSRIAVLRVCYLLLCLRSPQNYYEMPMQDSIHVLNVAVNSKQATRAFFNPLRKAVMREGNWFQTFGRAEVAERVTRRGRPPKRKPEEGGSTALLDTIRFPKNIEAVSGHSDADSQEGLNLIMGVADEIDAFKTVGELEKSGGRKGARESSSTAEAILQMLQTSASTRFETYKNIRISWPRYVGSKIMQLVEEGRRDEQEYGKDSRHYVSGPYATWEVNPRVRGKEQFAKDYRDDPVMAKARYECKPSFTVSPYFANEMAVRACGFRTTSGAQPLEVDYVRDGQAWSPRYTFSPELYPVQGARYAMHADLAVNSCRAGVALAHVQTWKDVTVLGSDEGGLDVSTMESRPVVKVDFVIGFEADKAAVPVREIQIRWVGDLVLELRRRGFIIAQFTADQWQSLDLQQRLTVAGIETDKFSMDRDETGWRTLRDLAYESRLKFPEWELLIREILSLSRLPNGKIDHPSDGYKDLADGMAGAVHGAVLLGGQEDDQGRRAWPGISHQWGGQLSQADMPIGMPALPYLSQPDEFIPEEVKDREMDHLVLPGGGFVWDTGESYTGMG